VNANKYITGDLPDIGMLMDQGCNITLGTDSLASNHQLSIAAEMKTIHERFPSVGMEQLLRWATSNGAKALKADHQFGSFGKGKRPGILLIEEDFRPRILA
jgi:cytosine/adenosine deaminase-related metal-dependent hydrolase